MSQNISNSIVLIAIENDFLKNIDWSRTYIWVLQGHYFISSFRALKFLEPTTTTSRIDNKIIRYTNI